MKIVIALCLLGVASAQNVLLPAVSAPAAFAQPSLRNAPPLTRTEFRDLHNQFSESYSTAEGTSVTAQGKLVPTADGRDYVLIQKGNYGFYSPEGKRIEVAYKADQNGFQVQSNPNV